MKVSPVSTHHCRGNHAVLLAACVALLLIVGMDFVLFVNADNIAHSSDHHIPGYWSAFGFAGACVLIIGAKAAAALGLQREEAGDDD